MCASFAAKNVDQIKSICFSSQDVDFSFQISTRSHYQRCYFCVNCLAVSVNGNF